ncbi:uncharacterized protein RBU57_009970 [Macrochelys suwanniensis]
MVLGQGPSGTTLSATPQCSQACKCQCRGTPGCPPSSLSAPQCCSSDCVGESLPGCLLVSALCQVGSWAPQQQPALELQFAMAKARRQRLREQHQQLIQQELLKLEEELAGNQELPPAQRDVRCWPKEKAVLALQLEALRREWAEAEKDLEALYHQHRLEVEAQKQHVLQVFRAYQGLSEEQTDALDQRYRKLLQEALQDAIFLSAQNQKLWAHSQLGCTERATQTDPHS